MIGKKFFTTIVACLLFSSPLTAQVNWEQIPGLPGADIIATAEFNSQMYAITEDNMYISSEGRSWGKINGTFPPDTFLDLTANDEAIWVSMNNQEKVYYSTDGETWTSTNEGLQGINFAFTLYGHKNYVYAYIAGGNLYRKNSVDADWELLSQLGNIGAIMRVHMADSLLFAYGNQTQQFGGSSFLVSSDSGRTFTAMGKTDELPFRDSFAFPSATLENFVELTDSVYAVTAFNLGTYSIHLKDSLWIKQLPQQTPVDGNPSPLPRILQQRRVGDNLIISTRIGLFKTDLNYENVSPIGSNPPDGNITYFDAFSNNSFLVNHKQAGLLYLENETAEYLGNPVVGFNEAGAELISDKTNILAATTSEIYISMDGGNSWLPRTQSISDALGFDFFGDQNGGHAFFAGNGILLNRFQLRDTNAEERIRYFATEDGGESWTKLIFNDDLPIDLNSGISLTKSGSNYIMTGIETTNGFQANIYVSTDLNFEESEKVYQTASAFFDDIHKYLVEGSLLVRLTINENRERHILVSTDAGATWELKDLNVDTGTDFFGATNLVELNGTLVAFNQFGRIPEKYRIFISDNTGTSWTEIAQGENLFGVYHNMFKINGTLYLVEEDGTVGTLDLETQTIEDLTPDQIDVFGGWPTDFVQTGDNIISYNEDGDTGFYRFNPGSSVSTEQERSPELPHSVVLNQNYPNPFNPSTQINFQLQTSNNVILKIYDMLGREVATLVDRPVAAGSHTIQFDASGLASGLYFYQIKTDNFVETRKMMLLK